MLIPPIPGRLTLIVWRGQGREFVVPIGISTAGAVSRERVAAPGTVAGSAAVVSEAPVAYHAPVAVGPGHPRLARAVAVAGVTEGHRAEGKGSRSDRVAGTCFTSIWGREGSPEVAVETRLTALAVLAFGIVLAVAADAAAAIP